MNSNVYTFFNKVAKNSDVVVGIAVIGMLLLMVLPLNAWLLDFFLVLSIASSIGVLMMAIYTKRLLDFTVFPTILLVTTLFRLSLNVASTRLILTHGHQGGAAAGHIIESFGLVVVGGNYVVGLILFIILVIINFVVITKGAGRVSEVAARFTLDSLPGKQMAIDADLNAGIINEKDAKRRRQELQMEADFYGSMDGSSKFVRGDAIAAILITVVNIIGGIIIGMVQKNLSFPIAAKNYTLLTVGDGLVAQVPALIISTAAGLWVTRASQGESFGNEVAKQVFVNEKIFYILGGILFFFSVVFTKAFVIFALLGACSIGVGYVIKGFKTQNEASAAALAAESEMKKKEKAIEVVGSVETIQIEVGYGLISLVDNQQKGDLLERIQSIRRQFAQDLGIVVPPMSIKDNLQLMPGEYSILLKGVEVGRGELMVDHFLAMDPGGIEDKVDGLPTKEPVFGLDAIWIHENNKEVAQLAGYTVVDLSTVVATHLTEVVRKNAHELLGRQEVQELLDVVRTTHPKVVDELVPKELSLGQIVRVLQNLLKEQVPVRDLIKILEALADGSLINKDTDFLTEHVRSQLGKVICRQYLNDALELPLITLDREIEEKLINSVQPGERPGTTQLLADPALVRQVIPSLSEACENLATEGLPSILLVTPILRPHVKRLLDRFLPQVIVLSHNEIDSQLKVKALATVGR